MVLALGYTAFALGGCGVAGSKLVGPSAPFNGRPACDSDLGYYSLPKGYLHVYAPAAGDATYAADFKIEPVRHPDPAFTYCLAYFASPLAGDSIQVFKGTWTDPAAGTTPPTTSGGTSGAASVKQSGPYLGVVAVNATDQTSYILRALIRAVTTVAGLRTLVESSAARLAVDVEFDPFDRTDSTEANRALRARGYCVVIDGITNPYGVSPEIYCKDPGRYRTVLDDAYEKYETPSERPPEPGIFYRPRAPYHILVYRKADPGGRGDWSLFQSQTILLENRSPVLSLRVDRTYFAGRRTFFGFDQGDLAAACVAKSSEILGFVDVPIELANSLVALPAQIVSLRVSQANGTQSIIDAHRQLLLAQETQLAALSNPGSSPPSTPGVTAATGKPLSPVTLPTPINLADASTSQNGTSFPALSPAAPLSAQTAVTGLATGGTFYNSFNLCQAP